MPKTQPDVILHLPQTQLQAAQTRLTDYLLQAQYAFMQSFSGHADATFDIFPCAMPESVQLVLCPAQNGTFVEYAPDHAMRATASSDPIVALMTRLVAVCTAEEGTLP